MQQRLMNMHKRNAKNKASEMTAGMEMRRGLPQTYVLEGFVIKFVKLLVAVVQIGSLG